MSQQDPNRRAPAAEVAQMRRDLARMESLPLLVGEPEAMRLRKSLVAGLRVRIRVEESGCECAVGPSTRGLAQGVAVPAAGGARR